MKKMVFVTGSMGRGGAERVISLLSDYYAQKGWSVSIAMLLHNITDGYTMNPDVQIVNLSQENMNAVIAIPLVAYRLRKYFLQQSPDIVVSFMAQNTLICGLATVGLKMRFITSERIDPAIVHRNRIYRAILNKVYAQCDRTIMQTQRAWSYFPEKVRRNSIIIPNPISVKAVAAPEHRHRIVTAGRLEKQKNQTMLIDAFAELQRQNPEYTLDIFGEGTLRDELQAHIEQLGLMDYVNLRGSVSNLHEQMADAEIFVLPSNFEGLSNALLEAMMMGLPCIATNCAGCDEVIEDGVNGLLVPVGDTEALKKALLHLANNEEYTRRLGQKAAESTTKFEVNCVINMWCNAIEGARE